jgi:tripartite-type tricarboxylate transporter receptor subunit TctC
MNVSRRTAVSIVAAAILPQSAHAQAYPVRAVRIVVGFPPGGGVDLTARIIAQFLSEHLGQPFVIENRPGAGSNLATETVVRAAPDGYTLLMFDAPPATNAASLYDKLAFDFARDVAPVAGVIRTAHVMVVDPNFPAKSLPELIAYAKAHPRALSIASYGAGTISQVAAALFMMMAGVELVHVPYRGSAPALTDLMGGQVQVMFAAVPSAIAFIRAGRLRPLGVSTVTPAEQLPNVPPVASAVPGFEASGWYGVGAPKGTPPEIIERLNGAINAALADPIVQSRLADSGGTALTGSPADLAKLIAAETAKWDKVIRTANIKATE